MGNYYCCCSCSLSEEERHNIAVNKEIKRIKAEQKKKGREIKMLLLGAGDSGKTTFMKQMRMIHGSGYSEEERCHYRKKVFQNISEAITEMTKAMKMLKIPYSIPQNENRMEESLALFYMVIHSPWFPISSIILFLSKMDILAEKIQFSDLKTYFPQFEGSLVHIKVKGRIICDLMFDT
ncbi:guanine nucleotide-binding subunit alpha-11-like protein [Labeo rohita]|uniref:Guanine nucleotide-binding subunit alpha-11-like protein n=1 Tax=Labeo rohita TaxID=84645 RepID=A0A498LEU9_LABRO|nr:guanine nucleotide-binding subunit alpha-11-like protein [Labeo rohita]